MPRIEVVEKKLCAYFLNLVWFKKILTLPKFGTKILRIDSFQSPILLISVNIMLLHSRSQSEINVYMLYIHLIDGCTNYLKTGNIMHRS